MSDQGDDFEAANAPAKRKRENLPARPAADARPQDFAAWLTRVFGLHDDPIIGGERFGRSGQEPITLRRASGALLRWDKQDDLMRPGSLLKPLIMDGIAPRRLSGHDALVVAWVMIRLAELRADLDARDEAIAWWESYSETRPEHAIECSDPAQLRVALLDWQRLADLAARFDREHDHRAFVLTDTATGERFVRRGDFGQHVRNTLRGGISWRELHGRMREVGWELDRLQFRATASGAPYVDARVYVIAPGWPDA